MHSATAKDAGLLPADDEAVAKTVERVREELSEHGLLLRYRAEDGLAGKKASSSCVRSGSSTY